MKTLRPICTWILFLSFAALAASAQEKSGVGQNAALRYWSAFSQMQDEAITDEQAKELFLIVQGKAPYDDLKYRDLVEKNRPALETMARGTGISVCDWGVEYSLGADAPVEYVRKAHRLGGLNVLYTLHLLKNGDKGGAVRTLVAGVRFSHDVANGGTLFATLVAKRLLDEHVRVIDFAVHVEGLSTEQKQRLLKALSQLGPGGLDWKSAVKREFAILHSPDSGASQALARITPIYLAALDSPAELPKLRELIADAPKPAQDLIPSPDRVVKEKDDLSSELTKMRTMLQ